MKKLLCVLMATLMVVLAFSAMAEDLIPVGVTFGDLANPVWADCANWMEANGGDYGFKVNVLGCTTSEEQIEQIENYLTQGCKAIVVGAKDTNSMGDYAKGVVDGGTVVFALGYEISNYTAEMFVKNYEVGYAVAKLASKWIVDSFGDAEVEVIINDAPEYDVLVDRVNGMKDALAEFAPNAKIVNYISGTTTNEIQPQAENAFTANPNVKCCITVGDGGALACKEAAAANGINPADIGIFCVDCTSAVATNIRDNGAIKGAICLGGGATHGRMILECLQKIFAGEEYEAVFAYPEYEVTAENVVDVCTAQNIELK